VDHLSQWYHFGWCFEFGKYYHLTLERRPHEGMERVGGILHHDWFFPSLSLILVNFHVLSVDVGLQVDAVGPDPVVLVDSPQLPHHCLHPVAVGGDGDHCVGGDGDH
jgi:hypothetical protein